MLLGFSETNQATAITNPRKQSDQLSKNANTAIDTLQAAQAIQYAVNSAEKGARVAEQKVASRLLKMDS